MLIAMDSVLYWSFGLAVGFMTYYNLMDIRSHYKILKGMADSEPDEFLIEYSDCPDWCSKVALYLVKKSL